jgi:hypothetical protein
MSESTEPGVEVAKVVSDLVFKYYPHTPETLVSIMSGLASVLVTVAIARFGKEQAPAEISEAVNAALIRITIITDEEDRKHENT